MSPTTAEPRLDRLYRLLPAVYRMRDAKQGYPLQALLRVIAEQANVVEDDIQRLYENWFIETTEEWAVPYIADLIGYRPVVEAGAASGGTTWEGRELNRFLVPRREVANTIRYRRRKGTLALLELLANDVARWPARAVEFFRLLGWNQNINRPHLDRAQTANLRQVGDLDLLNGPFDSLSHTVDVRRVNSHRTIGRENISSVGVFVWRLKAYSVTFAPAHRPEGSEDHCGTFDVLGQDTPLFIRPEPETDPTHIAMELNLPAPIRRLAFSADKTLFYGAHKSLAIWAEGWADFDPTRPLPVEAIIPADLTSWQYLPPPNKVAVDPVLGRFAFPPAQLPEKVRVTYHYAFSWDIGAGEYSRPLFDPSPRQVDLPDRNDPNKKIHQTVEPTFYRVGEGQTFHRISDALRQWGQDKPFDAVIELTDGGVYAEPISIALAADQTLQVRAANRKRPVIRLHRWQSEWQTDSEYLPHALMISLAQGSRFTMDGLLIAGRDIHIDGPKRETLNGSRAPFCPSQVVIRHCTMVPTGDCEWKHGTEPTLELHNVRAKVHIEHSILSSIQVHEDEVNIDPIPLRITNSILDAGDPHRGAIGAPRHAAAHTTLMIKQCTVFGIIDVHAVELAENCIFCDCVNVARRQIGCMRFCYVPTGCRTPRRYNCQPDLVTQSAKEAVDDPAAQGAAIAREQLRLQPQFTSVHYGDPGYAQLALTCADEIKRGADDESEMGAFHDLFQSQREANLRARLEEYTPAGLEVGIIYAN